MLRPGTQDTYISRRANMPTAKSHADLVSDVAPQIKAQAFFSARVAEAHILDRLREVSDGYSRGEYGLGEARNLLKDFLKGEGYDPHQAGLRNLAGTARLNLILKQNAAMANAAAEWKRMHDPDAMKVFPYVRYHARSDGKTRSAHGDLDGKIFRKDDPFLSTHTPPWEFNCRCYLEEITEKEAGRNPDMVQEPTPADKVTVDSESGFQFNPEHAFEEFEMSGMKTLQSREAVHDDIVEFCKKENCSMTLQGVESKEDQKIMQYREPENIEEIKNVFRMVEDRKNVPIDELSVSVGKLLPEHSQKIGIKDFDSDIIFNHPGHSKAGTVHWEVHHDKTLNVEDAIRLFRLTIWNPEAKIKEDINGKKRRLCIYVKNPKLGQLANVWVTKDPRGKLKLELIDSWDAPIKYIEDVEKK